MRLPEMDAGTREGLHGLAPGTLVMAPFGVRRPAHAEEGGLRVFTGRYPWGLPMLNQHMTADKIAELEAHAEAPLLVPDVSDGSACRYDLARLRRRSWEDLLPFYLPRVRYAMTAEDPLCAYIKANYRLVEVSAGGANEGIWVRAGE